MSRAFVKEDERETEVVAKRPQRQHPYYVTPEGYEQLARRMAAAQAAGDEREAEQVQGRIDAAIVVRPEDQPKDAVHFGASVTVETPDKKRTTYRIVGEDEADPTKGSLSWVSPLARQLQGKRIGDDVTAGAFTFEIEGIT